MKNSLKYIVAAIVFVVLVLVFRFCDKSKGSHTSLPPVAISLEKGNMASMKILLDIDSLAIANDSTIEIGVCWSVQNYPQISDSVTRITDYKRPFVVDLSHHLEPGTKYFVRGYVRKKKNIVYSEVFTVLAPRPLESDILIGVKKVDSVKNEFSVDIPSDNEVQLKASKISISDVWQTGAAFSLNVESQHLHTALETGICYSANEKPTVSFNRLVLPSEGGRMVGELKGLASNKTFYARSYVINSKDTLYGPIVKFTTPKIEVPIVAPVKVRMVKGNTMTLETLVLLDGGSQVVERGVCWGLEPEPSVGDFHAVDSLVSGVGVSGVKINELQFDSPYYIRAYAINGVGIAYSQEQKISTSVGAVGDVFAGGIIFYLDNSGRHGAVCADKDQSAASDWKGAIKLCKDLAYNGYSDWELPTKNELDHIYTNLYLNNIGGLSNYYWSSTENDFNDAWYWRMNYGSPYYNFKGNLLNVRAIRRF